MKSDIKIILITLPALAAGIIIGYFLFGAGSSEKPDPNVIENNVSAIEVANEEEIWTCSMHPQIRQNEPGECPICGMDLIPLEKSSSNDPLILEMTHEAVKLANIQTTVIGEKRSSMGKSIRFSGKVQADERLASSQVSHIPGRIEKLFVTFTGEQVQKGQKIAELYSPELVTAQSELLEALKLKEINPGLVEAARTKLRYWKIRQETITSIEEKGEIQETFILYADESGIVTNRRIAVGDYVKQGEPLFDMMNLNRVWVLFDAYEEDLASISLGDQIEFTTPAIPNKTFKTRITFIDPVINPQTRIASLRTEIVNRGKLLKPEMFVTGILKENITSNLQLTVPKSAVLWTGTRSVVYVKVPDATVPSFQYREVELGESLGDNYQLVNGLETGEEVVTYGNFSIDAAAQLNNQISMMNKNVMLKGADHSGHLPDFTEDTPLVFKQQIENLTNVYLMLKDAFVATSEEKTKNAIESFTESLSHVDMSLVKGDAHLYWMEQLKAFQAHSKKIDDLDNIEEQRKQFDFLSQALIKTIKVFGISENTYYVQHCPMAIDNKGANWVSAQEEIQNPYFGDQMLTCGSTEVVITKDFKNPPMEQVNQAPVNLHNH